MKPKDRHHGNTPQARAALEAIGGVPMFRDARQPEFLYDPLVEVASSGLLYPVKRGLDASLLVRYSPRIRRAAAGNCRAGRGGRLSGARVYGFDKSLDAASPGRGPEKWCP
jgi:hypothetical protein